jgi:hypothetical protein
MQATSTQLNPAEEWLRRWKEFALMFDVMLKAEGQGRVALGRQCAAYSYRLFISQNFTDAIPAAHFGKLAAPDLPEVLIVHGAACYMRRSLNPDLLVEARESWQVAAASESPVKVLAEQLLSIIDLNVVDPFKTFLLTPGMPFPSNDFTVQS